MTDTTHDDQRERHAEELTRLRALGESVTKLADAAGQGVDALVAVSRGLPADHPVAVEARAATDRILATMESAVPDAA